MTPKEKALELFTKYKDLSDDCNCLEYSCICFHMGDHKAKECALIVINEIIKEFGTYYKIQYDNKYTSYWESVKLEIEKLCE